MQQFFKDNRGHSSTEYAILIGIIISAVVAVGFSASDRVRLSSGRLMAALDGSPEAIQDAQASELVTGPVGYDMPMKIAVVTAFLLVAYLLLRKKHVAVPKKRPSPTPILGSLAKSRTDRINAILRRHRSDMSSWEVQVQHIMDVEFPRALETAKIPVIEGAMSAHDQEFVVLTDARGQFVSTYPEDIVTASVDPTLSLTNAIARFQREAVDCLLVVQNDQLKGIVTDKELIATLNCMLHLVRKIDAEHRDVLRRAVGV